MFLTRLKPLEKIKSQNSLQKNKKFRQKLAINKEFASDNLVKLIDSIPRRYAAILKNEKILILFIICFFSEDVLS